MTTIDEVNFKSDSILLTLPVNWHPFIHHEWLVRVENYSSVIILDIENFDGTTPAELIIFQSKIRSSEGENQGFFQIRILRKPMR